MPFERTVKAVFIEDVWDAAESLRINLGLRYDHFSDFGEEFSPRAGLNWEFVDNYFLKLNYGRAFRAPIYNELYSPTTGNSDIEPETTDSYELGLAARFWPAVNWQVTYFYRERNDFITLVDGVQQNVGKVINRGVEAQLKYDFSRGSYLSLNYTHIDPEECPYYQPERMGAVVANWRLNKYLNWNAHCLYRGGWRRQEEDPRDDLDDYTIVNTKLTVRQFLPGFDGLELGLSVFNLFDEEYYEPSTYNQGLPGDFPLPGRNFLVELRYTY
jgi:iron complex outermembrane receptor protein